jgi:hypothetical protein
LNGAQVHRGLRRLDVEPFQAVHGSPGPPRGWETTCSPRG